MSGDSLNITLVGSGNVAWHMGHRLVDTGCKVDKVISRGGRSAKDLAGKLQCDLQQDYSVSNINSDFVIAAINDNFLAEVLKYLDRSETIIVHTSGSLDLDVFPQGIKRYGVLYPFQTLTTGIETDFSKVPLCIEASDQQTCDELVELANRMTSVVNVMDSQQRRILHLAGVISNNFTNHLVGRAQKLLEDNRIDKSLLMPLLEETLEKLKKTSAENAQTGPARRNNSEVIEMHKNLLKNDPDLKKLYSIISDSIIAYYS